MGKLLDPPQMWVLFIFLNESSNETLVLTALLVCIRVQLWRLCGSSVVATALRYVPPAVTPWCCWWTRATPTCTMFSTASSTSYLLPGTQKTHSYCSLCHAFWLFKVVGLQKIKIKKILETTYHCPNYCTFSLQLTWIVNIFSHTLEKKFFQLLGQIKWNV